MCVTAIPRPAEVGWLSGWKSSSFTRAVRARRVWAYGLGAVLLLPALCLAMDVRVVGVTPGMSAAIVIEGGTPITIDVGHTVEGVKLLRADQNGAVVQVNGVTKTLPLVAYSGSVADATGSVTIAAAANGQFYTSGVVNGHSVKFLVDTGATLVSLPRADAGRMGLRYREGTPTRTVTANGIVNGWVVSLDSVRVGQVTVHNVAAFVSDNDGLPIALLGMSFLGRFDMQRQGSTLVLRHRR